MAKHRYTPLQAEDEPSRRVCRRQVIWIVPLFGLVCLFTIQQALNATSTSSSSSTSSTNASSFQGSSSGSGSTKYKVPSSFPSHVVAMLDVTRDPCENFYQFACGKWLQTFEMPATLYYYMFSSTPTEQLNREILKQILDGDDAETHPTSNNHNSNDSNRRLVSTLYRSCVNESAIEQLDLTPLLHEFARIDDVQSVQQLMQLAGEFSLFQFHFLTHLFVGADDQHATVNTLKIRQADLMLDQSLYQHLAAFAQLEPSFREYIGQVLTLSKVFDHGTTVSMNWMVSKILTIEKTLARLMQPSSDLTDAFKRFNPIWLEHATQQFPLSIGAFMDGLLISQQLETQAEAPMVLAANKTVLVQTPQYFDALEELLEDDAIELTDWKLYFKFRYVDFTRELLSDRFAQASFAFYDKQLEGLQAPATRQTFCVDKTVQLMPNRMGKLYAERRFDAQSESIARELLHSIETAMHQRLVNHEMWLDEPTRQAALDKIPKLMILLGSSHHLEFEQPTNVPDPLLVLRSDSFFNNTMWLRKLARLEELDKLSRPVDRSEWTMAASDVNAYYDEVTNHIEYPAGILQPPLFDRSYLPAINYGATGVTMGHELTHAFDVVGRLYDGDGNLAPWWTNETNHRFTERAKCIENQYSQYALPSCFNSSKILGQVDGHLTLGESMADLGGLAIAFDAYKQQQQPQRTTNGNAHEQAMDQLFYIAFAQSWCTVNSDEDASGRLTSDVHPPILYRVNGPVRNDGNFAKVFHCPVGSPMNPPDKCRVW